MHEYVYGSVHDWNTTSGFQKALDEGKSDEFKSDLALILTDQIPKQTNYGTYQKQFIDLYLSSEKSKDIQYGKQFYNLVSKILMKQQITGPVMKEKDKATERGETPLMLAILVGNDDAVKQLIANDADLNKVNNEGDTALMLAVKTTNKPMIELLSEQKGKIHFKIENGTQTAYAMLLERFGTKSTEEYKKFQELAKIIKPGGMPWDK